MIGIIIAAAFLGALGNRIRGGLFPMPGGTQVGRLVGWGLPCALVAWTGLPWWAALPVGVGAFAGACVGQYGGLSMGHRGARPAVSPWLTMFAWGSARTVLPAMALFYVAHDAADIQGAALVLESGAVCPVIYWAVWYVPGWAYLRGLGYGDGPATGYDPPELAEAIHGALMLAVLAWAVQL